MDRLKIGAVSYLNSKPLVYGLEHAKPEMEIQYDVPSRLADRLADQELDAALIPVVEAIQNPSYTIVSDACIACRGPVWSVKLFSRVPFDQVRSLSLDEGSRTSIVLAMILLKQEFQVDPICHDLAIGRLWTEFESDAALVIGDRAMHHSEPDKDSSKQFPYEIDLGEFWYRWTRLPFVFAVWAARPTADLTQLDEILTNARNRGVASVDEICEASAAVYPFSKERCREYLTNNLHFQLGDGEKKGLNLFLHYAKQQSLIHQNTNLQFYDCQTTG